MSENNNMEAETIASLALQIAEGQAGVKTMSAAEVVAFANEVTNNLRDVCGESDNTKLQHQQPATDPAHSIRLRTIVCLECGQAFKMLTIRHLHDHGLTAETYKKKWGIDKHVALTCKELGRKRRKMAAQTRPWLHTEKNRKSSGLDQTSPE